MRKRRGTKKIDKVEVTGPEGRMMVDIYLNTDTSEFQAELFGDSFHNEDLNALKRSVKDEAKQRAQTTFKHYIQYTASGVDESKNSWARDRSLSLSFSALAVSDPVGPKKERYKISASVDKDDVFHVYQNTPETYHGWGGERLVPFTPARWRTLNEIQAALIQARARLAEILGADADEVANTLDSANGVKLLMGGSQ